MANPDMASATNVKAAETKESTGTKRTEVEGTARTGEATAKSDWRLHIRWIFTILASLAVFIILWEYESKGTTQSSEKRFFNFFIQGGLLILSMNFPPALKEIAVRLLNKASESSDIDDKLKEKCNKLEGLLQSCWESLKELQDCTIGKPASFYLIIWLVVVTISQIILAVLGSSYSYETSNDIQTESGRSVNITSLQQFHPLDQNVLRADIFEDTDVDEPLGGERGFATDEDDKSAIAHTYGEVGISLGQYDPDSRDLAGRKFVEVEQRPSDFPNWEYHFREFNLNVNYRHLAFRTNRYVTVEPRCESSPVIQGSGQEWNQTLSIRGRDGSMIDFNWLERYQENGSSWIYPKVQDREYGCGARCARIYAASFRINADNPQDNGTWTFFNCTIEISQMHNADPHNPLHRFPDDVAVVLASSIAFQAGDLNKSSEYVSTHYSDAVVWGNFDGINSTSAADLLGRFTVGAIAIMDVFNTKGVGSGRALEVGVLLVVDWKVAGSILGVITAVHTLLYLFAYFNIGGGVFTWWARQFNSKQEEPEASGPDDLEKQRQTG